MGSPITIKKSMKANSCNKSDSTVRSSRLYHRGLFFKKLAFISRLFDKSPKFGLDTLPS